MKRMESRQSFAYGSLEMGDPWNSDKNNKTSSGRLLPQVNQSLKRWTFPRLAGGGNGLGTRTGSLVTGSTATSNSLLHPAGIPLDGNFLFAL